MTDHDTTPLDELQLQRLTALGRTLQLQHGDEGPLDIHDAIEAAAWVLASPDPEPPLEVRGLGGGAGGTIHVHYDGPPPPPPPAPPATAAEFLAQAIRGGSPINTVRPGSVFGEQL